MSNRIADVTYHGIQNDEQVNATFSGRIFVEQSKTGPTERETAKTLRELTQGRGTGWSGLQFGWGYNGAGTSAAARAILADAMGVEPGDDLREDFAADVLTYMYCDGCAAGTQSTASALSLRQWRTCLRPCGCPGADRYAPQVNMVQLPSGRRRSWLRRHVSRCSCYATRSNGQAYTRILRHDG
jgi:hypothetical protein